MDKGKQQKTDLANAKHGLYVGLKRAGKLFNGRMTRSGFRLGNKKKEMSRKACRKGNW